MNGIDEILMGLSYTGVAAFSTYFSMKASRAAIPALRDLFAPGAGDLPLVPGKAPNGHRLESRCLSVDRNAIRQTDGAFVAGFELTPMESLFAHDDTIAEDHRRTVTWLTNEAPVGTIYQFRQSVNIDEGTNLRNHLSRLSPSKKVGACQELHARNLKYLNAKIESGEFKSSRHTLWVRVPTGTLSPGIKLAFHEMMLQVKTVLKTRGRFDVKAILDCLQENELVRRMIAEENAARKKAEDIFQQVLRNCPFEIRRFTSSELWDAIFFSHNELAVSSPRTPSITDDIGRYLSDERIVFGDDAIVHGRTPVAIVSMTTPPQSSGDGKRSGTFPTVMRPLSMNPRLLFRHTFVTELEVVDQMQRRKLYDRKIEWTTRAGGNLFGGGATKEAGQQIAELDALRGDMATGQTQIMSCKKIILVYGEPLSPKQAADFSKQKELPEDLSDALDRRAKAVLNSCRDIPGVNAIRENRSAALCLYPGLLVGEISGSKSGREIEEIAQSVATFINVEKAWSPSAVPHTFFRAQTGELTGIDLFEAGTTRAPGTALFGETGSGKSVLAGVLGLDTLATHPTAKVQIVDFNSFKTMAEVTGGLLFQFDPKIKKGFNIGYYDGLREGLPVEEEQVTLVLGDLKALAGIDIHDSLADGILEPVVREVYTGACAHNRAFQTESKKEPILSDFIEALEQWCGGGAFDSETIKGKAQDILLRLRRYRGNPWLDNRMDPSYLTDSSLIVYDMESLALFPEDVRRSLAYRVAVRTTRAIGPSKGGERLPRLNIFDEMGRIASDYPEILYAISKGAFQGRKENVRTLFIAQNAKQVDGLKNIVEHVGLKIIGRQNGDYSKMISDFSISKDAAAGIENISNLPGSHAQFVMVTGEGVSQRSDLFQLELSDYYLWTFTSEPNEVTVLRAVREKLGNSVLAITFLANRYPRGLAFERKTRLTDEDLAALNIYADQMEKQR